MSAGGRFRVERYTAEGANRSRWEAEQGIFEGVRNASRHARAVSRDGDERRVVGPNGQVFGVWHLGARQ